MVERLVRDQEAVCSSHITPTRIMPGNRVFMRFPGVSVCLCFQAVSAADPYRDPYGIWAGGFWPLGLSPFLCSGNSIALCSICEAGLFGPDICPEMPHVGVLSACAGFVPFPGFRRRFGRKSAFSSLKRNDLQFPAVRVRIRHGGDFPGIKQRRSRRGCWYHPRPAQR